MDQPLKIVQSEEAALARVGRYVVDFGDHTETGVTARDVAALLESEKFAHIKLFKIHRAYPDGTMELVGVPNSRFQLEDCFLFYRSSESSARADFEALRGAADAAPPPCRARVHLAKWPDAPRPYLVALLYPAEYSDEMGRWLNDLDCRAGDTVEGGVSHASNYVSDTSVFVVERLQLWGAEDAAPVERDGQALRQAQGPARGAAAS